VERGQQCDGSGNTSIIGSKKAGVAPFEAVIAFSAFFSSPWLLQGHLPEEHLFIWMSLWFFILTYEQ
jgi:hypothetical protein